MVRVDSRVLLEGLASPSNCSVRSVVSNGGDSVVVSWGDDEEHATRFSVAWLESNAPYLAPSPSLPSPPPSPTHVFHAWTAADEPWPRDRAPLLAAPRRLQVPASLANPTTAGDSGSSSHRDAWRLRFHRALRREGAVLLTGVLRDSDLAVQERVIEGATGMRAFDCDYGKVWETRGYGLEVGSAELAEAAREVKWHSVRHAMSPLLCWDLLLVVCDSLSVSSSPSPCDQCMNERTNE